MRMIALIMRMIKHAHDGCRHACNHCSAHAHRLRAMLQIKLL